MTTKRDEQLPELLTPEQAARLLGVSATCVRDGLRTGRWPFGIVPVNGRVFISKRALLHHLEGTADSVAALAAEVTALRAELVAERAERRRQARALADFFVGRVAQEGADELDPAATPAPAWRRNASPR